MFRKVEGKKQKGWCSKHQVVHTEGTAYWSCSFPNDKKRNEKFLKNRRDNSEVE